MLKTKALTSCSTRAHGAVAGVVGVAADVADAGVQQALVAKVFAVHVLDAPEAAGGERALLRALRDIHSGGLFGCETQGGGGEWAGQLLEDTGHRRGAGKREQDEDEGLACGERMQIGGGGDCIEQVRLKMVVSISSKYILVLEMTCHCLSSPWSDRLSQRRHRAAGAEAILATWRRWLVSSPE